MFAVVIRRRVDQPEPVGQAARVQSALDPLDAADRVEQWSDDHCTIIASTVENTPESVGSRRIVVDDDGTVLIGWTRLDDRTRLAAELGRDLHGAPTDADLLIAAYRRWGERCPEHLTGAFSLAVWNPHASSLFVARDQLGFRPLFLYSDERVTVVATSAAVMPAVGDLRLVPDQDWMAGFIVNAGATHTGTAWPAVHKLAAGHTAHFDRAGARTTRRYHEFVDDSPHATHRDPDLVEQYRTLLEAAVADRMPSAFPLGFETSGGIDSSTCLALGARHIDDVDRIHTFGFIGSEDEPDFIYETSRAYGITNDHIDKRGSFETWPQDRSIEILGYPAEHNMGPAHVPFYVLARRHGVRTLFSGFGGDEVVTNPANIVRREFLHERRLAMLWRLHGGHPALRPLRFLRSLERSRPSVANTSLVQQAQTQRLEHLMLRPDLVDRLNLRHRLLEGSRYTAGWKRVNDWVLHDRLGNPFVPARLESCAIVANAFGIEYRWPLLDMRLVQCWLSAPSIEKYGPGIGRYLHRQAIDGIVPDRVAWKPTKDMGPPISGGVGAQTLGDVPSSLDERLVQLIDPVLVERAKASAVDRISKRAVNRQFQRLETLDQWLRLHHT